MILYHLRTARGEVEKGVTMMKTIKNYTMSSCQVRVIHVRGSKDLTGICDTKQDYRNERENQDRSEHAAKVQAGWRKAMRCRLYQNQLTA